MKSKFIKVTPHSDGCKCVWVNANEIRFILQKEEYSLIVIDVGVELPVIESPESIMELINNA